MDEAAAIQIANEARAERGVSTSLPMLRAERRIIELEAGEDSASKRVRDVRVWIVRFQDGMVWAELAVDEATRTVVRVERSRAS